MAFISSLLFLKIYIFIKTYNDEQKLHIPQF